MDLECCSYIVVSVVIDMAFVGVLSHQGGLYCAQSEPHQLLHSSGASGLLPRPLGPGIELFLDKMLQVGGGGLCG